jgi:hypothetical protein
MLQKTGEYWSTNYPFLEKKGRIALRALDDVPAKPFKEKTSSKFRIPPILSYGFEINPNLYA